MEIIEKKVTAEPGRVYLTIEKTDEYSATFTAQGDVIVLVAAIVQVFNDRRVLSLFLNAIEYYEAEYLRNLEEPKPRKKEVSP